MSDTGMVHTNKSAFINAKISISRLVSEKAISSPASPTKEPQQVQLRTETSSAISIGIDSPNKPSAIAIGFDYKVSLMIQGTDKVVMEYEARHEAQFVIDEWTGFDDWTLVPQSALNPYIAMMQHMAIKRAENTISEMGMKGVTLPFPERFDGQNASTDEDEVLAATKV